MVNELNKELKGQTLTYISGALGLVAGLAWNEAITALINALFPLSKDALWVKFLYAIIVTVAVVLLVRVLKRTLER